MSTCREAIEYVKNELKKTWEPKRKAYWEDNNAYLDETNKRLKWETDRDVQQALMDQQKFDEWMKKHPEPSVRSEPTFPALPSFTLPPQYQNLDCCVQNLVSPTSTKGNREYGNIVQSCLDSTSVTSSSSSSINLSPTPFVSSTVITQTITSPPSGTSSALWIVWFLLGCVIAVLAGYGLYRAYQSQSTSQSGE